MTPVGASFPKSCVEILLCHCLTKRWSLGLLHRGVTRAPWYNSYLMGASIVLSIGRCRAPKPRDIHAPLSGWSGAGPWLILSREEGIVLVGLVRDAQGGQRGRLVCTRGRRACLGDGQAGFGLVQPACDNLGRLHRVSRGKSLEGLAQDGTRRRAHRAWSRAQAPGGRWAVGQQSCRAGWWGRVSAAGRRSMSCKTSAPSRWPSGARWASRRAQTSASSWSGYCRA